MSKKQIMDVKHTEKTGPLTTTCKSFQKRAKRSNSRVAPKIPPPPTHTHEHTNK